MRTTDYDAAPPGGPFDDLRAVLQETVDSLHWWHMRTMVRDNLTPLDGPHCDNETCIRARAALGISSGAKAEDQHLGKHDE